MPPKKPKKRRIRIPRKLVLTATAGLASVTLQGCLFTSGNLVAPPPCDDAGHYDCTDAGVDAGGQVEPDAGHPADGGGAPDGGDAFDGGEGADGGDASDGGESSDGGDGGA